MEIELKQQFGIRDAGDELLVKEVISKMDLEEESKVVLNFKNCLMDYPNTAILVDHILSHLLALNGQKELKILVQFDSLRQRVLNDLFNGSYCLGFQNHPDLLSEKEIESAINEHLLAKDIKVEVLLIDYDGNVEKQYY